MGAHRRYLPAGVHFDAPTQPEESDTARHARQREQNPPIERDLTLPRSRQPYYEPSGFYRGSEWHGTQFGGGKARGGAS